MKRDDRVINHPELSSVIVRPHPRARRYTIRVSDGNVVITMPQTGSARFAISFLNEHIDQVKQILARSKATPKIQYNIEELRTKAKEYLPDRVAALAQTHGFRYEKLTIRNSRTRWGSCSSLRNISLSLYLVLLPSHLIDYVILHELCHTVHMNHSPSFWDLLDSHTNHRAKELRKELRSFNHIL